MELHKSEQMMQLALSYGWKAQIKPEIPASGNSKEIVWNLYCVRGRETMRVTWVGDRQQDDGVYTYDNYRRNLYRTTSAVRLLKGVPNPKWGKTEELLKDREIPFNSESPAMEILLAVLGKDIVWIRKIDGEVLKGTVEKETNLGKKYFRIYSASTGRRILEWQDREGFHAVGLDQIIDVVG